jgi:ribonuclease VapC
MLIDSSAIVAMVDREPEFQDFAHLIASAPIRLMSTVTLLETSVVLEMRYGPVDIDGLIVGSAIDVIPFDRAQTDAARAAYRRFGQGLHPAALNFGDCAAYALAKVRNLPLLFKGDDFTKTDIAPAYALRAKHD